MRKWMLAVGLCVALVLPAFGGVALAAPGASGHGPSVASQGTGHGKAGASHGKGSAFGQSVAQAVYTALSSGEQGTALANAVHMVISTFKPNAKGMAVAEAVYQSTYAAASGTGTISMPFTDMGGSGWAAPYVAALANNGVVRGTTDTTFSPGEDVTGAQLLTMLDRMQNWPAGTGGSTSPLLEKAPAFALKAIEAAISQGTVKGVGDFTNLNVPLTRAQAIALLINSIGLSQLAQSESTATISLSGPVPSWARGDIALAIGFGLVEGSNGQILANQTLTRAQMAALLARLAELEALSVGSPSTTQ